MKSLFLKQWKVEGNYNYEGVHYLFRKKKLRKEYDQKLIDVMEITKEDWLRQKHLENLSYEQSEDLRCGTLLAQAKYFFLFREAKLRKVSIKK